MGRRFLRWVMIVQFFINVNHHKIMRPIKSNKVIKAGFLCWCYNNHRK